MLILLFVLIPVFASAQNLVTPKELIPSTAYSVRSDRYTANNEGKITRYYYQWRDQAGNIIRPYAGRNDGVNQMPCYDWDRNPAVANSQCQGAGDPDPCCTGPGSGTCDDRLLNSECVAKGDPLECCVSPGIGICECWQYTKSTLITLDGLLKDQLEIWEGVQFAP